MTERLRVNELEDESLRDQFNDLLEAMEGITTFDPNREEGSYEALNQRIYQAVTDKPILARIVDERDEWESLLSTACSNLNLATSHHVVKSLIQAYPRALITVSDNGTPLYMIAYHPVHCVLIPWIVTNYPWVLDHERYIQVVFGLLRMYAQRQRTSCTSTTFKQFFEAYPRAFTQQHPNYGTILHMVLKSINRNDPGCEVDLFKWVANRCGTSLSETDSDGNTALHLACKSLSRYKGRDSSEICKYLIQKCPCSVQMTARDHYLPIHYLQGDCGYRFVREVVVCLLREYPESYDMPAGDDQNQSSIDIPFILSIKTHLDEEKELKETAKSLMDSSSSFTEAVACSKDDLMRSAFTVFDSWSTSFVNTMEGKVKLISTQLQDLCNEGRESDE